MHAFPKTHMKLFHRAMDINPAETTKVYGHSDLHVQLLGVFLQIDKFAKQMGVESSCDVSIASTDFPLIPEVMAKGPDPKEVHRIKQLTLSTRDWL